MQQIIYLVDYVCVGALECVLFGTVQQNCELILDGLQRD